MHLAQATLVFFGVGVWRQVPLFAYCTCADAGARSWLSGHAADWVACAARVRAKWEEDLWRTMVVSAQVWLPMNFLNFYCVAPHLRVVSLSVASVCWFTFLSLVQNKT